MNATREYAIPSFQNRRLRRDYVLATKINREEMNTFQYLLEVIMGAASPPVH